MGIIRKTRASDEVERSIIPISPEGEPEGPTNSVHVVWRRGSPPALEIDSALQLDTLDRVGEFQTAVSAAVREYLAMYDRYLASVLAEVRNLS
jgi:hypothetical protein